MTHLDVIMFNETELKILKGLADFYSKAKIQKDLDITQEKYTKIIDNIKKRMKVNSTIHAIILCIKMGYLKP